MLIVEDKRKLVLRTDLSNEILAVIPHAKKFQLKGETLTAVQHGVEEAIVLKNLGFKDTPSPILSYYDWPSRFKAMEHQKQTSAFLTMNRKALVLNSPGTGKSLSALWAADFLLKEKLIRKVLIIAPLSTVKVVWGKEIRHHLPHRSFEILTGTREQRIRKLQTPGVQFLIVNHDGFSIIQKHLDDVDVVIYDECFVAGTRILTPSGHKPIELIRTGDEVRTPTGNQRVLRTSKRLATDLITLELSNGAKIHCTRSHPVFTDIGWLCAADTVGRRVFSAAEVPDVSGRVQGIRDDVELGTYEGDRTIHDVFEILRRETKVPVNSRDVRASSSNRGGTDSRKVELERGAPVGGRVLRGEFRGSKTTGSETCDTRREREGAVAVRSVVADRVVPRVYMELPSSVGAEARRLSYDLQSRFRESCTQVGCGSRRSDAHYPPGEDEGHKENRASEGTRVVGITSYQHGRKQHVYNLEVEDCPHYYAEGVLVHNCTALKGHGTQRFRNFFRWTLEHDVWLWMLTGTPISQSPVDAWTLAKLVGNPFVPRSFTSFKDMVMAKISTFRWVPRPEAMDICQRVLQPSIRFSLEECMEIPDTLYLGHECPMSVEQLRAFKEMQERAILLAHDVSAPNMAVVLQKLVQICCGVVYGNSGDRVKLDFTGRYDSLKAVLAEIGILPDVLRAAKAQLGRNGAPTITKSEKAILFVPLRGVQDCLLDLLLKEGYDVASVNGDVTGKERNDIFDAFQNSDRYHVLLAHPKVAAHGLTLTRAKDVIWYAPIYSLEQYEQANARVRRISTQGKTRVHHLWGTKFERELYSRLQNKRRILAEFLELVQGVNER